MYPIRPLDGEPQFVLSTINAAQLILPFDVEVALREEDAKLQKAADEAAREIERLAILESSDQALQAPSSNPKGSHRDCRHLFPVRTDVHVSKAKTGLAQVFEVAALRRRIDAHNLGTTGDEERLRRDQGMLESLAKRGQLRKLAQPEEPNAAFAKLRHACPHMSSAVEAIENQFALRNHRLSTPRLTPMLIVGAPGVGKTHFSRELARTLGAPLRQIDMATAQHASVLAGTDKHWSTSAPGVLCEQVLVGEYANPVVLLDELDKANPPGDRHSPIGGLHTVLEASTAARFVDLSLDIEFDVSNVTFVATANTLKGLPDSLLSRFLIIHAQEPSPRQALEIARTLAKRAADEHGFDTIDSEVVRELAQRPPRALLQALTLAMGRAAAKGRRRVTIEDLMPQLPARCVH